LAEALKKSLNGSCPASVLDPVECLRATVIGASQYTVQVSGSTIFQSRDDLLPLNNLPVLLHPLSKPFTKESLASSLMEKVTSSGMDNSGPLAIAFHLSLKSTYEVAKTIAQGVAELLKRPHLLASPLTLVFNQDIARTTGEILHRECQGTHDIISVDEIELREFDYIDIGEPFIKPMIISDHTIVPIVVKSLVFSC